MANKVIVIGGGAAGIMAAIKAAQGENQVTILEKNDRLGRKLSITGKGRCNITNSADIETFIDKMPGNGQFLYGPFYTFTNLDMMEFLKSAGLEIKEERGGRIFPVSDKAADVIKVLEKKLSSAKVNILFNRSAASLLTQNGHIIGVQTAEGEKINCDAVILATGGASYPATGSTGDGYRMAERLGHTIIKPRAALVPLETMDEWVKELQGLALKNVEATVYTNDRKIGSEFGEMLFTHFGISGPIILTLSREITNQLAKGNKVEMKINLKPALTKEQLDQRFQRDFAKFQRKQLKNSLDELLPSSMIPVIINLSGISPEKPVHQITREERHLLVNLFSGLKVHITKPRPLREAIVTAGGVAVDEINPSTMESKIVEGLYFAGEVIDIDGYTGGYNLQAAWSTGFVAGVNVAETLEK